ncbi:DUF6600 domain-containing protein [Azorhizobium doebereinerae]|uniref:DUF6600 domain-containing protein n=1 Tax=Azorhizobium doebereinerae TaxID=281091 RepID=UPI00040846F0|nr:DUF6600 domain-containing protein [Azorhizobium doebereinerae]
MTVGPELKRPARVLVAGIAASFLLGGVIAPAQAQPAPRPAAARQQVDINVFYAPLAEHGTWVAHPTYQYVWVPSGLDASWRPYQDGRWLWTDDGWYWDSAEPFAWATYHYGRWGYEPDYGWYWVPGDTWAPAWVQWRRGGGRTGWAPVAPDAPGYAYGAPRRYDVPVAESWVFVEDRYLAAPDLAARVLPVAALAAWLGGNPRSYDPAYGNGRVVTRFVPPTEFGDVVEREVITRRLVYVDRYQEEFDDTGGARIGIYRPYIGRPADIPPPPRVMRELPADRRIVIRQYVEPGAAGILAPSAALLSVLGPDQRRALRDARFSGDERAYHQDIDRYRADREQQLQQEWQQAERNRAAFERARLDGLRQREQMQRQILEQRQQRATQVIERLERERPDAVPPALPQAPNAPGGRALPGPQPGTPAPAATPAPGALPAGAPPAAAPPAPNAAQAPNAPRPAAPPATAPGAPPPAPNAPPPRPSGAGAPPPAAAPRPADAPKPEAPASRPQSAPAAAPPPPAAPPPAPNAPPAARPEPARPAPPPAAAPERPPAAERPPAPRPEAPRAEPPAARPPAPAAPERPPQAERPPQTERPPAPRPEAPRAEPPAARPPAPAAPERPPQAERPAAAPRPEAPAARPPQGEHPPAPRPEAPGGRPQGQGGGRPDAPPAPGAPPPQ